MAADLAGGLESIWEHEPIHDTDTLYMRIHRDWFRPDGTIRSGAFVNRGDGMSTNWDKYSTPQDTRKGSPRNPPEDYGVVALSVGSIRSIPHQMVEHTPTRMNRAHTDVLGEKTNQVRVRFIGISQIVLPLDS